MHCWEPDDGDKLKLPQPISHLWKGTPLKFLRTLIVCAAATCTSAFAQDAADIAKASDAAQQWLSLVDSQQYGKTWSEAAPVFQQAIKQGDWEKAVGGVRGPVGALKSRTLKSATFSKDLPGAPKGDYVVIVYDTEFANKAGAIETVAPMRDSDGRWKVSGYFVR